MNATAHKLAIAKAKKRGIKKGKLTLRSIMAQGHSRSVALAILNRANELQEKRSA